MTGAYAAAVHYPAALRHTFLVQQFNGKAGGSIVAIAGTFSATAKPLMPRQAADPLGRSASEIADLYYVRKDAARLSGIADGFEL